MRFRQLVFTSVFYGGVELLGRGMQAITMFVLAGAMSKTTFGEIGFLFAVQQMVMSLCLGGLVEVVSGRLNQFRDAGAVSALISKARYSFWRAAGIIGIGLVAVTGFDFLPRTEVISTPALLVACVSGVVFGFAQLEANARRLMEHHKSAMGMRATTHFLAYGVGLAAAVVVDPTPTVFFGGLLLGLVIGVAFNFKKSRAVDSNQKINTPEWARISLGREGFPFLVTTLVSWAVGYGANIFIFYFLGKESVAEYTLVLSATTVLLMVANAVNQVWTPRFLAIASKKDGATLDRENVRATSLLQSLLAVTAAVALALYPMAMNFGGSNLRAYAGVFDYLAIAFLAFVSLGPYYGAMNYYLLHRKGGLLAKVVFLASVIGLPVWLVLVALFGNLGIYVGWALMTISRGWAVAVVGQRQWNFEINIVHGFLPVLAVAAGWAIGRSI